jgi:UDP-glucose 4-epimerase
MDKVVVIGGAGFMGSHTADELTKQGYDVTIFDQVESPWVKENQKSIVGDILDRDAVKKAVKGAKYLYHYAGIADIAEASISPYDTINSNVMGTTLALEVAVEEKVERFIYASSMYVYSEHGSFYRASKQAAETVIEAFSQKFDLDYTMLRYGSLYGPRSQNWNGLKRFLSQIVNEGKLDYFGTGKERREYIHVGDAARLSVDILDLAHKNEAITVTGSQVLNSSELIDMMFEIAGCKKNVSYNNNNIIGDHYIMTPYRYVPQKAKKLVPDEFLDVGEGILELIYEIHNEKGK